MTAFQKILITLLVIAFIGPAWLLIASLRVADPGITAAVIAALVAVAGTLYTHIQIRKREVKAMHFTKKKNAYMLFIDLIFPALSPAAKDDAKRKGQTSQKYIAKKMMEFKKELMVWGNHDVFQALEEYEQIAKEQIAIDREFLPAVEKLLRAMRKDLGHDDSQLKDLTLLLMFAGDKEREELLALNKGTWFKYFWRRLIKKS